LLVVGDGFVIDDNVTVVQVGLKAVNVGICRLEWRGQKLIAVTDHKYSCM